MNKNNKLYLIVGVFVVVGLVVVFSFWLWLSSVNRQASNIYTAIFHEPVNGLTINSVVKYNGVDVGRVSSIELDVKDPRVIYVYLSIAKNIPINVRTYATMNPQGVTGLSYIDLHLPPDANIANNLVPKSSPPYPKILTEKSFFYTITKQAGVIGDDIHGVAGQLKMALNEKNIQHFSTILANLEKISTSVASRSEDISKIIKTTKAVMINLQQTSQDAVAMVKDIRVLSESLHRTSENANGLILNVQNDTLYNINGVVLPNLNHVISHMDQTSYQLELLLQQLNQNPSIILRGRAELPLGPGETR